jgi:hypothetical protein
MSGALKDRQGNWEFTGEQKHLGTVTNDMSRFNPKNKDKDKDKKDARSAKAEKKGNKKKVRVCFCGHSACGIGHFVEKEVDVDDNGEIR